MNFGLIIILSLLPSSHIPFPGFIDSMVPDSYNFHDVVCINDTCNVHIFITSEMPNACKVLGGFIIGCSLYGGEFSVIYLREGYLQDLDIFGFTTFEHEALHVECQCNFHQNQAMVDMLADKKDPYNFVMKYKFLFQTGTSLQHL